MEHLDELERLVQSAKKEGEAFFNKGNASAGTRLRKLMQSIRKTSQTIRSQVQDKKKSEKETKGL